MILLSSWGARPAHPARKVQKNCQRSCVAWGRFNQRIPRPNPTRGLCPCNHGESCSVLHTASWVVASDAFESIGNGTLRSKTNHWNALQNTLNTAHLKTNSKATLMCISIQFNTYIKPYIQYSIFNQYTNIKFHISISCYSCGHLDMKLTRWAWCLECVVECRDSKLQTAVSASFGGFDVQLFFLEI